MSVGVAHPAQAWSGSGSLARPARRIVSLLPSATEIVCALGLQDRLVSVTHECDFPADALASIPRVTEPVAGGGASVGERSMPPCGRP